MLQVSDQAECVGDKTVCRSLTRKNPAPTNISAALTRKICCGAPPNNGLMIQYSNEPIARNANEMPLAVPRKRPR